MKNKPFTFHLIFHFFIFAAFFLICAKSGFKLNISTDLFSMIPESFSSAALKTADQQLTGNAGRSVFILSRNKDFSEAKKGAEDFYSQLCASPDFSTYFESLSLYSDTADYSEIQDFLQKYRWNFLSTENAEDFSTAAGQEELAAQALNNVYGGFSISGFDYLEADPFMLDDVNFSSFLQLLSQSGTKLSPKDGVLANCLNDEWFVMLQGTLTQKGAALAKKHNGVQLIYDVRKNLEALNSGTTFVLSGTPFHSHNSSTNASREITLISIISMTAVLIMLIAVFRSPLPVLASFCSILLSVAAGFCAAYAVFGKLHVLTLVFGTSLIGSCIDYSLHFFVNWKFNTKLTAGGKIRSFLKKSLVLSLISTEIAYILLIPAPFPLLKQMAVFSLTGILSAFLTVICVFPVMKVARENASESAAGSEAPADASFSVTAGSSASAVSSSDFAAASSAPATSSSAAAVTSSGAKTTSSRPENFHFPLKKTVISALSFVILLLLCFNHSKIFIKNNLSALYKMSGRLKDDTILSSQVLNYTSSSWFILQADSPQALLEKEEAFAGQFEKAAGKNFICTASFLPSLKKQKLSEECCASFMKADILGPQFEALGFEPAASFARDAAESFAASRDNFITEETPLPAQLEKIRNLLWLGQIDGSWYSVFLPSVPVSREICMKLQSQNEGVFYENKVEQISDGLDELSKMIIKMFALAWILIFVILKFFFTLRQTIKIAFVPLFSVAVTVLTFVLTGTQIDFFCITGVLLVFGMGIDYIIYMTTSKSRLEKLAVILSFATTALSFGSLALSSFVPVHAIGLSIFSGLTGAFVCAMLL